MRVVCDYGMPDFHAMSAPIPPAKPAQTVRAVPIDLIRPGSQQARRSFDAGALAELAERTNQDEFFYKPIWRAILLSKL